MLQLIQMVDGYEPVEAIEPPAPSRRRATARRWCWWRAGAVELGAGPDGFAYDNERPRHTVELDAVPDRPHSRSPTAPTPSSSSDTGAEPPMYWEADGELVGAHRDGPPRAGRPRRGRDPRRPGTRPTRSRGGPGSACPPSRSGRRRPRGADRRSRQPRPARLRAVAPSAPTPTRPRTAGRVQMLGDVWEWTSSDFTRLSRLRGLPLSGVLGGLLRRHLQGAARRRLGDPAQRRQDQLPQLGPAASAARSSPARCAGR